MPLQDESFDVVVIGGGINGVAIARECARAGRSTLLLESHDFGAGTTSRSTRIIHGGLRYLEHGELGLVRESLRERRRMIQNYPHLVRPLDFLLALDTKKQGVGSLPKHRSALQIRLGLWLYRTFARIKTNKPVADADTLEQELDHGRQWSVFHYEDAQCEFPERLVAEWLHEAMSAGAEAFNHTKVLEIDLKHQSKKLVRFRDSLTGGEGTVEANWIINATGPWVDRICNASRISLQKPLVGGVRGTHIVLKEFTGAPHSAVYTEAPDGRAIFVVPWNDQLLVGTTEIFDDADPSHTAPSQEEINYLLNSVRQLFPRSGVSPDSINYAFAGVRPLPFLPGKALSAITRKHVIHDHIEDGAPGVISIVGGKLTTAAALARDCARKIGIAVEDTELRKSDIVPADEIELAIDEWSQMVSHLARVPEASARGITEWFGARPLGVVWLARNSEAMRVPLCPHTTHIVAEAVYAAQNESAESLADILLRRVPVAMADCWSEECSVDAAGKIARELNWSDHRAAQELESFEDERQHFLRKPSPQAKPRLTETRPGSGIERVA